MQKFITALVLTGVLASGVQLASAQEQPAPPSAPKSNRQAQGNEPETGAPSPAKKPKKKAKKKSAKKKKAAPKTEESAPKPQ